MLVNRTDAASPSLIFGWLFFFMPAHCPPLRYHASRVSFPERVSPLYAVLCRLFSTSSALALSLASLNRIPCHTIYVFEIHALSKISVSCVPFRDLLWKYSKVGLLGKREVERERRGIYEKYYREIFDSISFYERINSLSYDISSNDTYHNQRQTRRTLRRRSHVEPARANAAKNNT